MEGASATSGDRLPTVLLHTAELIKYRDERRMLVFTLLHGEPVEGTIRWFDEEAIHLVDAERSEVTLFKHAIASYRSR